MPKKFLGLLTGALLLIVPASAGAAPVTVNLRVEGPTQTLFEGPVTTDIRDWQFTAGSDTTPHQCDGTAAATGGSSPTPVATGGAALMAAGLTTAGSWISGLGFSLTTINGLTVSDPNPPYPYMVEFYNGVQGSLGACAQPLVDGDSYVFGYGEYGSQLLKLSAPVTAGAGQPVTVKVTDAGTGSPVAGASVGGATTDANGDATVGPLPDGVNAFKASKSGAIRSNTAKVCVNTGNNGLCGTLDKAGPRSVIAIKERKTYRGRGPRTLRGTVSDAAGVSKVQLRLTVRPDIGSKSCRTFNATLARFVKQKRCGAKRGKLFTVDASGGKWTYLLPEALRKGRYVLDVIATDTSGNKTLERVIFYVK